MTKLNSSNWLLLTTSGKQRQDADQDGHGDEQRVPHAIYALRVAPTQQAR